MIVYWDLTRTSALFKINRPQGEFFVYILKNVWLCIILGLYYTHSHLELDKSAGIDVAQEENPLHPIY